MNKSKNKSSKPRGSGQRGSGPGQGQGRCKQENPDGNNIDRYQEKGDQRCRRSGSRRIIE